MARASRAVSAAQRVPLQSYRIRRNGPPLSPTLSSLVIALSSTESAPNQAVFQNSHLYPINSDKTSVLKLTMKQLI